MHYKFMNAPEREAYRMGYERGKQEGLQKAAMLIQQQTAMYLRRAFSRIARKRLN